MSLAAGWQVRALLGHYMSFFQLARPLLSIFRAAYDFLVSGAMGEYRDLPVAVKEEFRVARALIFTVQGSLRKPPCLVAYVPGASMKGYAISETGISRPDLRGVVCFRERSRFSVRQKFVDRAHSGFRRTMAGPSNEPDFFEHWGKVERREFEEVVLGPVLPPLPDAFVDERRWRLIVAGTQPSYTNTRPGPRCSAFDGRRRTSATTAAPSSPRPTT